LLVRSSSICECISSEVVGLIAFIFGRMIGHEVYLIILSRQFELCYFNIFMCFTLWTHLLWACSSESCHI
jgi:hypothetical protein